MGLYEASSYFLQHGDAILAVISRRMECFPNVDSWSNIEWFTNGGRRCFGHTSTWKRRLLVCFGGQGRILAGNSRFWRAMAYLGGEYAVTRHCLPKPISLGTQVNLWRAMACNPQFPAIARPYPPVWELRLKLRNEFGGLWRDPA